ncbi:nucleoside phosphorylase domain-containing protein [Aspergillus karnatakaensis]|uniref:nucleoside phosphorylase domain-containing protein n=1 Tax=Aspergillus karnatakaensis TaxID=1810916 RepID=UPI003CCD7C71
MPLTRADYTVGWVASHFGALPPAQLVLDKVHEDPPGPYGYTLGSIGHHNIAILRNPRDRDNQTGPVALAKQFLADFQNIRYLLLVGFGGGIPTADNDIRLGDVVVSPPDPFPEKRPGIPRPSMALRAALYCLQARHIGEESRVDEFMKKARKGMYQASADAKRFLERDDLYPADYMHRSEPGGSRECWKCDPLQVVPRPPRESDKPVIHYGLIVSVPPGLEDNARRDLLDSGSKALCVDTGNAAKLLDSDLPFLVIRGISDYADSHRHYDWQWYAAAAAAAYAKELLLELGPAWPPLRRQQPEAIDVTITDKDNMSTPDHPPVLPPLSRRQPETIDITNTVRDDTPTQVPPPARVLYEAEGYGWSRFVPIAVNGAKPWRELEKVDEADVDNDWVLHRGDIVTVCVPGPDLSQNPDDSKAYAKVTDLRAVGDGRYMVVYTWLYTREEIIEDMETGDGDLDACHANLEERWPKDAEYEYMFSTNRTVTLWNTAISLAPEDVQAKICDSYVYITKITAPSERWIEEIGAYRVRWLQRILQMDE